MRLLWCSDTELDCERDASVSTRWNDLFVFSRLGIKRKLGVEFRQLTRNTSKMARVTECVFIQLNFFIIVSLIGICLSFTSLTTLIKHCYILQEIITMKKSCIQK